MRYKVGGRLGAGTFREVYRATDIDSGNTMAVKIIKRPEIGWNDTDREKLRREVTTLASISHVSVHCSVFYFPTYFLTATCCSIYNSALGRGECKDLHVSEGR